MLLIKHHIIKMLIYWFFYWLCFLITFRHTISDWMSAILSQWLLDGIISKALKIKQFFKRGELYHINNFPEAYEYITRKSPPFSTEAELAELKTRAFKNQLSMNRQIHFTLYWISRWKIEINVWWFKKLWANIVIFWVQ